MARRFHRFASLMVAAGFVCGVPGGIRAAPLDQAEITGLNNQVHLVSLDNAARPATLRTNVGDGTIVQTGRNSRAELTFADQTVIRLAANTIFGFTNSGRDLNLGGGALLVESPKNARSVKLHAGEVAAAIGGTTAMLEYHSGFCKFLVLEGTGRLYRPAYLGDSVLVKPGQIVIGGPNEPVSDPADFDIGRFVRTSHLLVNLPALPSGGLIAAEIQKQQGEKMSKTLIETNLVIYGGGTQVSLVNPVRIDSGSQKKSNSDSKSTTGTRPKRTVHRHKKSR